MKTALKKNARLLKKKQRFGRWTVLEWKGKSSDRDLLYLCRCDCGTTKIVKGKNLKSGKSKSCGCLTREKSREIRTTHGKSESVEHRAWQYMKTRCKSHPNYKSISVCKEWKDSFERFFWDMGPCPEGGTLDRINPWGNYEPQNCRWIPRKKQALTRKAEVTAEKVLGRQMKENEMKLYFDPRDRSKGFAIIPKDMKRFYQKRRNALKKQEDRT